MALIGVASGDWHNKDGKTVWGGSGWARLGQYIEHLDQFDWVVGTLVWDHDQFKIVDEHENTHSPDALFLHRLMHKGLVDHIKLARKAGQKIINDLDDWYWGLDPRNQAFTASHPKHNDREDRYSYRSIISNSDLLIVSTKYLASRVDWVKAPITVVENTVDVGRHTPIATHDDTVPLVGWVGSTNHRSGDLETMRGILSPLWRNGDIRLQHSGFHSSMRSFAEAIGVPEAAIEVRLPLSSHADYPSLLTMDVGIVPLRNAPFNQSKSYIKGLEYAASGIPFVAQDLDAYRQLRSEYGIGLTAAKPADWIKLLKRMKEPGFRAEHGAINRERVWQRDLSVGVKEMADALASVL